MIPELDDMWDEAPVLRYQLEELGGWVATPALWRAAYKAAASQLGEAP